MTSRREPVPLRDVMAGILGRLGFDNLDAWATIRLRWAEIAEPPWDTQATPVALHDGVLVVEVSQPGAAGILRYGQASLERRLAAELGEGVVGEVRIRAPSSRR